MTTAELEILITSAMPEVAEIMRELRHDEHSANVIAALKKARLNREYGTLLVVYKAGKINAIKKTTDEMLVQDADLEV